MALQLLFIKSYDSSKRDPTKEAIVTQKQKQKALYSEW